MTLLAEGFVPGESKDKQTPSWDRLRDADDDDPDDLVPGSDPNKANSPPGSRSLDNFAHPPESLTTTGEFHNTAAIAREIPKPSATKHDWPDSALEPRAQSKTDFD
jgi:hypothetical protein